MSDHPDPGSLVLMTARIVLAALAALCLTGCGASSALSGDDAGSAEAGGRPTLAVTGDPDEPTGWGPTRGELAEAMLEASEMSVAEQAATVLMPGFWGYSAT